MLLYIFSKDVDNEFIFFLYFRKNMDEFMPTVSIDNNMHGKFVEAIVKSIKSELKILKN